LASIGGDKMSLWLFRAGRNGEYEDKFLTDNLKFSGWTGLGDKK
jgi:hypothetical protein